MALSCNPFKPEVFTVCVNFNAMMILDLAHLLGSVVTVHIAKSFLVF
jgi:hypothetical protein